MKHEWYWDINIDRCKHCGASAHYRRLPIEPRFDEDGRCVHPGYIGDSSNFPIDEECPKRKGADDKNAPNEFRKVG